MEISFYSNVGVNFRVCFVDVANIDHSLQSWHRGQKDGFRGGEDDYEWDKNYK